MEITNAFEIQSPKPWQFQKGVSGNPRGKLRGTRHFTTVVRGILKEPAGIDNKGNKVTNADQIVRALIKKAIKGDLKAIKLIFDRVDGKVTDKYELLTETRDEDAVKMVSMERVREMLYGL